MTRLDAYLEVSQDGSCMAHIPALPGCFSRGTSREAALQKLETAVQAYREDLLRHGEPVPASIQDVETLEFRVAGIEPEGPFQRGGTAGLFAPDREPLSLEEMETVYFRRAAANREDLLALARPLVREVLDWQPSSEEMTIRQILRHVGNAEEWYVSRLVSPETLPPEWEHDEKMPVFKFLRMERRTAFERLRQLSEGERSRVVTPPHFTDHPEEPWTARKALRRLLEHEREHAAHIHEVLANWRRHFLARLAAERGFLLANLVMLDEDTLTGAPVFGGWTAKDLLAHTGFWDRFHTGRMQLVMQGKTEEIREISDAGAFDAFNAEVHRTHRDWSLEQALAGFQEGRKAFLETFAAIPDADLHKKRKMPWGWNTSLHTWARWRWAHDGTHGTDLRKWRKKMKIKNTVGPLAILVAATRAARQEIVTLGDLLSPEERITCSVCGLWTLKDLLGHLADWQRMGLEGVKLASEGIAAPGLDWPDDFDAWNNAHATARQEQSWEQVWEDFNATRRAYLEAIESLQQEDLARPFKTPWSRTLYGWMAIWPWHERQHAGWLRKELGLPKYPKRLLNT